VSIRGYIDAGKNLRRPLFGLLTNPIKEEGLRICL